MKKEVKYLKEDIVSFETAKLAKEKGFIFNGRTNDWLQTTLPYHEDGTRNIGTHYEDYIGAPTQSLLQKWLRDKHHIQVEVNFRRFGVESCNGYFYMANPKKYCTMNYYTGVEGKGRGFTTYEEALEEGLKVGLNLIKVYKNGKIRVS